MCFTSIKKGYFKELITERFVGEPEIGYFMASLQKHAFVTFIFKSVVFLVI